MIRTRFFALMFAAAVSVLSLSTVHAQGDTGAAAGGGRGGQGGGRGNWDPAAMQQRMMDGVKKQLDASDEDWQAIGPLVTAVMTAQNERRQLTERGGGFGGRGGRGGDQAPAKPAEVEAVTKAVEAKDAAAIKTSLEALRAARIAKDADVAKAQASLREVLTLSQEATLVLSGMLE